MRSRLKRDELGTLVGVSTISHIAGVADLVSTQLSEVTGLSESAITVTIGMTFSILIELVGALLWFEALRRPEEVITEIIFAVTITVTEIAAVTPAVTDDITAVTAATKPRRKLGNCCCGSVGDVAEAVVLCSLHLFFLDRCGISRTYVVVLVLDAPQARSGAPPELSVPDCVKSQQAALASS